MRQQITIKKINIMHIDGKSFTSGILTTNATDTLLENENKSS